MSSSCQSKNRYAISICQGGHATLHLGRTSIFLELDELKSFLSAAEEALNDYQERSEAVSKENWSQLAH